jgi:hypothetical protein
MVDPARRMSAGSKLSAGSVRQPSPGTDFRASGRRYRAIVHIDILPKHQRL